jgi:hypothetical protein
MRYLSEVVRNTFRRNVFFLTCRYLRDVSCFLAVVENILHSDCHQLLGLEAAEGNDEVKDLTFQIGKIVSAIAYIILC